MESSQCKCVLFLEAMFKDYMYVKKLNCIHNGCLNAQKYAFNRKYNRSTCSLRPDTQLHVSPLGISFSPCVTQPFAFVVLETNILKHN